MSTKIYDGFVIKKPFTQIIPQLQEYKNMLRPHMRKKLKNYMACQIVSMGIASGLNHANIRETLQILIPFANQKELERYENLLHTDPLYWASVFVEYLSEICESPICPNHQKEQDALILFGLHLFPYDSQTYGIPYGAHDIISEFLKLPGVEDFQYYNNTDRPENITSKEWAMRGNLWKELCPTFYIADSSFQYEFFNYSRFGFPSLTQSDVSEYLKQNRPDYVSRRTMEILFHEIEQEIKPKSNQDKNYIRLALDIQSMAVQEIKENTKRASEAAIQAEKDIPHNYEELEKLLPKPAVGQD